jgi:hypothetical protein
MARDRNHCARPMFEPLESRIPRNGAWPINTIGTSVGTVSELGGIGSASVAVGAHNLTSGRHSTLFGVFVQPNPGSDLRPRIVAIESNGQRVPFQSGRPFVPGVTKLAAAFVQLSQPGPLTVVVAGAHHTDGSFTCATTLPGDVNGDGSVTLSDLPLFASAYGSETGQSSYNSAADFNLNGSINFNDAVAFERNMPPLTPPHPLGLVIRLLPSDQAHYPTSTNAGGATFKQDVTIIGRTTPGSLVIEGSKAYATNAQGVFAVNVKNTLGINYNNFLILDPFGHHFRRDFPIFWISFAAPGSNLK